MTQADLDAGSIQNTANAVGTGPTSQPVNALPAAATVTAVQTPGLTLVKTATPATYDAVGDVINYSYVVRTAAT